MRTTICSLLCFKVAYVLAAQAQEHLLVLGRTQATQLSRLAAEVMVSDASFVMY